MGRYKIVIKIFEYFETFSKWICVFVNWKLWKFKILLKLDNNKKMFGHFSKPWQFFQMGTPGQPFGTLVQGAQNWDCPVKTGTSDYLNHEHNFKTYRKLSFTDIPILSNSIHPVVHKLSTYHCILHRLINIPLKK